MVKRTDWAWLAGLLEGEGTFHIRQDGKTVGLSMSSTDFDVVEKVQRLFGGSLNGPYDQNWRRRPGSVYKPLLRWRTSRMDLVEEILLHIIPYLGARRKAKAMEQLTIIEWRKMRNLT